MESKTIREHRLSVGWTQLELAERVGTTATTVHRWEATLAEPTARALRDLARALDVSMDAIDLTPWDEKQQRHRAGAK